MRIVHILTRLLRAGSEENTLLTCSGQIEKGHEVFLLHGHDSAPHHSQQALPDLQHIEIPALTREIRPHRDTSAIMQTMGVLQRLSPDVVHTHQSKAGFVGRFAASLAGVPLVIHGVHILPFLGETGAKRAAYLAAERGAARVTDAYIHVSDGMREACIENGVGLNRPHYVVRSGFDLNRFATASLPDDWRQILGVAEGADKPLVVTMLSALEPRKNHLKLLENLKPLITRFPDIRIVFAGEGHMRDQIASRIEALGLQDQVRLLGYRSDPHKIIALSDLCVHCSDREGFPRSVLQYLAGGRPVVLFKLPGLEDVITDGRNGVIVPHGDWSALTAAVSGLLGDPAARSRLGKAASDTDLRRWDGRLMGEATLDVYDEVAAAAQQPLGVA